MLSDGRDTFLMTGGTIVGAFEDGDVAQQTSGTIGGSSRASRAPRSTTHSSASQSLA